LSIAGTPTHREEMSGRDEWLNAFPGILTRERTKASLTPEELAEKLAIEVELEQGWEQGRSLPTLPQFFELAQLFGWPIPRLLVEEGLTDSPPAAPNSRKAGTS
jgi:transcriptional regulator with XRE-family HTH domain